MRNIDILVVDDEAGIRTLIQGVLEDEGYAIRQAADAAQAYQRIEEKIPDLVILDIWLQASGDDGLQILDHIKSAHPHLPVLMISGHGTIETAVNAIKQGAYDFIEKPFKADRLLLMIERALETAALIKENKKLKEKAEGSFELVGHSPALQNLRQLLLRVAQTNSRILLTGEAGTGKEIAARTIHRLSQRSSGPFMALNCATLRPESLEIELFGQEAMRPGEEQKTGLLERADGGTLLLDEVSDMPLETQGKILRVLQEEAFQRVGGEELLRVDVRIIAATNRDLQRAMEEGAFREDLFFRLNVVPVEMPPLRSHTQDIPELSSYFIEQFAQQAGMPPCQLSESTLAALQAYGWPGNIRQLRNLIERLMIMGGSAANDERIIFPEQLPQEILEKPDEGQKDVSIPKNVMAVSLREARELFEKDYLFAQLERFEGNISKTAQFVGMERSALHRKLKQLGIVTLSRGNASDAA